MINRYFRCTVGASNKFWDVCLHGIGVTVNYGRIGTAGTAHVKSFDSAYEAQTYFNRKIVEKINKGYIELEPTIAPSLTAQPWPLSAKPKKKKKKKLLVMEPVFGTKVVPLKSGDPTRHRELEEVSPLPKRRRAISFED